MRDRRCGLVSLSLDDNALPGGNDGAVDATDPEALLAAHEEPHGDQGSTGARLNWLRAGVLGANDGIVSTAGDDIAITIGGGSPICVNNAQDMHPWPEEWLCSNVHIVAQTAGRLGASAGG